MPDEFGEKTEQPTDRRRTESRRRGNVARSQDLSAAGLMLAAALVLWLLGRSLAEAMARLMQSHLRAAPWREIERGFVLAQFHTLAESLATSILPLMILMMAAALLIGLAQVGFVVAPDVLRPKPARLNPIEGAKRILSIQALVKLAVSLGKLAVVVAVSAWFITSSLPAFLQMIGYEPADILAAIKDSAATLALSLALALVLLAILDFGFQKWKHEQDLKMTPHEVREELKQMEGDPLVRHRRREAHRKLAQARELGRIPDADVVVTHPTHIAVVLKYDPETMPAPTVLAKGMGEIAARIRNIAAEHGIPVVERKPLAEALYHRVKVGQQIPIEMYEVLVELMAYAYRLTGRTPPNLT